MIGYPSDVYFVILLNGCFTDWPSVSWFFS
jgi:hypothetical protein